MKRESITDILKKGSGTPVRVKSGGAKAAASSNAMGYYQFSSAQMQDAVKVAVQEVQQEMSPQPVQPGQTPKAPQVTVPEGAPALRPLVDELKSVLVSGFDTVLADKSSIELQTELIKHLKRISDMPAPNVEVNVPEGAPPVKKVKAVNITRDQDGNIAGAEFEIER